MKTRRCMPLILIPFVLSAALVSDAQQRGQYVPGQFGLNAGVATMPPPGFTFVNLDLNYSANALKDSRGSALPVTGTFSFWSIENLFFYVPESKILGGKFSSWASLNFANNSVIADFQSSHFGASAGGEGLTDTWVQPFNLGWHFPRVDTWVAYAFTAPTGKFSAGATNNNGSGYWGNNFCSGTTFYTDESGHQLGVSWHPERDQHHPRPGIHPGMGNRTNHSD